MRVELDLPVAVSLPSSSLSRRIEDWTLTVLLGAMAVVPVVELLLRAALHTGIFGAAAIVQHLDLAVGMLGGAVAARENRLLATSALTLALPPGPRNLAARFAEGTAFVVCVLLAVAGTKFVAAERLAAEAAGNTLALWMVEALIPLGFAWIAWRLLARTASNASGRWVGLGSACLLAIAAWSLATLPLPAFVIGGTALAAAAVLGAPIFAVLAGAALLLFWHDGMPLASIAVDHYRTVVNPTLPAIPLFTLAGYLLAESGAPARLIEVFDALFGRLRGGAAIATVLVCTFFTSFTGASGVTVLALGGLVMPLLRANGLAERSALGLVTAAGLPGTLLMPALPLILYAIVAGIAIEDMFLGGVLPTLLMGGIIAAWGMRQQTTRRNVTAEFDWQRVRRALAAAKWEITVPLVPLLALATGLATPVESAALTALYVFFVTTVAHRDLGLARDVPRVMTESGLIVGGILLVMGVALGLTDYLVDIEIPARLADWAGQTIGNRYVFLLALNIFLLCAGCVIEIYPAILILAPIVTRIGEAFAIHPVHLGIIFLANMELGYLTPLVGLNLFFASYRFGKPVAEVFRAVLPVFVALAAGILIVTYVPWLSTGLLAIR
jgi:tripartite ATP-independent transporter DctM subunit